MTKLQQLKDAAAAGDWATALRIAARFYDLGDDQPTITRAHECAVRPAFYRQLGRNPDEAIAAGIAALKRRYAL